MIPNVGCLSPHVARARDDCLRLEWHPPYPVLQRARPVVWTCHCRATVYELLLSAGRGFIRRTVQREQGNEVHETPCWHHRQAWAMWMALLSGEAR